MKKENKLDETSKDEIRIGGLVKYLWKSKYKFLLPMFLTGAISSAIMLCIPRYYKVKVMLVPEYSTGDRKSVV